MTIEYILVIAYMVSCIGIGLLASRKVLASRDEILGRRPAHRHDDERDGDYGNPRQWRLDHRRDGLCVQQRYSVIFIIYVSIGGMLAITWTDVMQGALMLFVVVGTALIVMFREGSPMAIMQMTAIQAPELGRVAHQPLASYLGSFVIWAAAIPVIPHIVMRVFTAKDAHGARVSLNLAMILYSLMILAAVFTIVPIGKIHYPDLKDADTIFLKVMQNEFPPFVRGLAVAAVLAAVMSTTDALLLACSSAITHDLFGNFIRKNFREKTENYINIAVAWAIGLLAMYFAYSPPPLITQFYSAAIGLLTATLFVPVIAGLWWKKANLVGGIASMTIGFAFYLFFHFSRLAPPLSAILMALSASALAMIIGSRFGNPVEATMVEAIEKLHQE